VEPCTLAAAPFAEQSSAGPAVVEKPDAPQLEPWATRLPKLQEALRRAESVALVAAPGASVQRPQATMPPEEQQPGA